MENTLLNTPNFSGFHNQDLNTSITRLNIARSAKDLSTICVIPHTGFINAQVAERWLGQATQMNQKFMRIAIQTNNKFDAYNNAIEQILSTPKLNEFKYLLTLENNTIPPFDGLIKLFESIDKYDVVSGLIWSTGEESKPQIFGHPSQMPQNFVNIIPQHEQIQPCLATTTSFTLYKLGLFNDHRLSKPWFRVIPPLDTTNKLNLPDFYFFDKLHKLGYKVACDTRIRIGNLDPKTNIIW